LTHLLNLLAAIALLVWGTHLVRTGILRVFGANLRNVLAKQCQQPLQCGGLRHGRHRAGAVQYRHRADRLVLCRPGPDGLPSALAVMLGADMGTSLMAVVFSRDLSWLSPLFIFVGVVLFITRQSTTVGRSAA
jgi:phosphate:Na+ symporter